MTNIFTKGKSASLPKKDDMRKHSLSKDHIASLKNVSQKKAFEKAVSNVYDSAKESIMAQLATLFVFSKCCIASNKLLHIINLQVHNGVDRLKNLSSEGGGKYKHESSVNDMYHALYSVVADEFKEDIQGSPYGFYGLEIDELTDSSNKAIVIMYVHFVNEMGHLIIRFLCVKELSSGSTADEIYRCVLQALDESDLDINKLCALATDGASVMTSVHKGVAARLKKDVSHLISTHCMAHRLQLVGEKAAAKVPLIQKLIDILNQFAKLTRILENAKQLNGEKAKKIKQVFLLDGYR